jgi:hypothetical protein
MTTDYLRPEEMNDLAEKTAAQGLARLGDWSSSRAQRPEAQLASE